MVDIVICEFMDEAAVDWLKQRFDVLYDPTLVDDQARLFAAIADVPALIVRSSATVDAGLLDAAPKLQVIGRLGVGLDRFDLDECARRGVTVCPARGANARSVAEYVLAMTYILLRGCYHRSGEVAAGAWPRAHSIGAEATGKTLGIIGLGSIGGETARLARAAGLDVIACDPYLAADAPAWRLARSLTHDEVYASADIVSLHTPLNDETRGLIGERELWLMKSHAVLINAARGGIVDEPALADALRHGRLAGAAIDVFETEPLARRRGRLFSGLANVWLTAHIAGVTSEANARVSQMTAENVAAVLDNGS